MSRIIAIGGVSRSGKSSLANWLHKQLPDSMVLGQDDFVQPESLIPSIKDRVDWEHPDSINWKAWQKAIQVNLEENEWLILEGLFMFHSSALPVPPTHCYYLSISQADFLKARQLETRWGHEPQWFIEHVWKSHFQHGLADETLDLKKYHNIDITDYQEILKQIRT